MNEQNTEYLCKTYPQLYDMSKPPTESLMCFGFPDDGWFNLIKDLSDKIVATGVKVHVVQVKEKFGTLRYYVDIATGTSREDVEKVYRLISEAEAKSEVTCEVCGEPGKLRQGGWIKCLCDIHANGREEFTPLKSFSI